MELALLRAIQELPGRQRAVLIFRDVLGWTAPEVAELLESSVASVNSALQRARVTIDERLPATPESEAAPDERELLERYVAAFEHDDVDGLVALLREDAVHADAAAAVPDRRGADRAFLPRGRGRRRAQPDPADCRRERTAGRRSRSTGETSGRSWVPHGISVLEIEIRADRRDRLVHQAGAAPAVRIAGAS